MSTAEVIDPRVKIIRRRLSNINRIYAIASSKGGVGKTLISVLLAYKFRSYGFKVGLLDLDFTNPGCHILLDIDIYNTYPTEEKGVIPPDLNGLRFMSIVYYTEDKPIALRGYDIDNAIKEIFTITRWIDTDILIIDMPPGLSDEFLHIANLIDKAEIVIVTTPSILSIKSIEKMIKLLLNQKLRVSGLIENMALDKPSNILLKLSSNYNIRYLGFIPYISKLDDVFINDGIDGVLRILDSYVSNIASNLKA